MITLETIYKREAMPQISRRDMKKALRIMDKLGVKYKIKKENPKRFQPSQKYVNKDTVENVAADMKDDNEFKRIKPIVISKDNWIVDGHHRWGGVLVSGRADELVPTIQIMHSRDDSLKLFHKIAYMVS